MVGAVEFFRKRLTSLSNERLNTLTRISVTGPSPISMQYAIVITHELRALVREELDFRALARAA